MVNRYQEPYLFALSAISSMRSFTWTLEDKGTQEGRQLNCHRTSPPDRGVMGFRYVGVFAVHAAKVWKKQGNVYCAVIPVRHHAWVGNTENNKMLQFVKLHTSHCYNCQSSSGV